MARRSRIPSSRQSIPLRSGAEIVNICPSPLDTLLAGTLQSVGLIARSLDAMSCKRVTVAAGRLAFVLLTVLGSLKRPTARLSAFRRPCSSEILTIVARGSLQAA